MYKATKVIYASRTYLKYFLICRPQNNFQMEIENFKLLAICNFSYLRFTYQFEITVHRLWTSATTFFASVTKGKHDFVKKIQPIVLKLDHDYIFMPIISLMHIFLQKFHPKKKYAGCSISDLVKKSLLFSLKFFSFFTVFIVCCELLNTSFKPIKISSSLLHKNNLKFMNENIFWQK